VAPLSASGTAKYQDFHRLDLLAACKLLQGIPDTKPATSDIGLTPDISKIAAKPDTSKIGSATKGPLDTEPLLKRKADDNMAEFGTGMGISNSAQDTVSAHPYVTSAFFLPGALTLLLSCIVTCRSSRQSMQYQIPFGSAVCMHSVAWTVLLTMS
jgi:hypothetical protein